MSASVFSGSGRGPVSSSQEAHAFSEEPLTQMSRMCLELKASQKGFRLEAEQFRAEVEFALRHLRTLVTEDEATKQMILTRLGNAAQRFGKVSSAPVASASRASQPPL